MGLAVQIPRHSDVLLQDTHSPHQMKQHKPNIISHAKIVVFSSEVIVVSYRHSKYVGHGQNSLLVISKFAAIRWSALLRLPLTAQWNTNVLSSQLKIRKVHKFLGNVITRSFAKVR